MRVEGNDSEGGERPFEYADPRSLSQAWFDALYGDRPKMRPAGVPREPGSARREANDEPSRGIVAPTATRDASSDAAPLAHAALDVEGDDLARGARDLDRERRDPSAARAATPRPPAAPTTFARNDVAIRDADGNEIRLLLAQHGERVDVVAIADPSAGERVAEAMQRARAALGARGIEVSTRVQERGER